MYKIPARALDWALNHVERHGDTDIFPTPFEFRAIRHSWQSVRDDLASQDLDAWVGKPRRSGFTPKREYSYRYSTQLDPRETLLYLALIHEVGPQIEAYRISDGFAHSYRFAPDQSGGLFSSANTWHSFQDLSQSKASEPSVSHVLITDIADYFNRLNHHPLENSLKDATSSSDAARVLFKLVSNWSNGVSYGIPVGPAPSRLLAELTITDVDKFLQSKGVSYCRYVDDFRIFCGSERDAYDRLAALALVLYENHGLSLQPQKTVIVTVQEFLDHHLRSFESDELHRLQKDFGILAIGPYETIEFQDLAEEAKEIVRGWNLSALIREQIGAGVPDAELARFALQRLSQLRITDPAEDIVDALESLYLVFPQVIRYLTAVSELLDGTVRLRIGEKLVALIEQKATAAHLPYHRQWLLSLFAMDAGWGATGTFPNMFDETEDSPTRRELALAMGTAELGWWFKINAAAGLSYEPWIRRAFLAGSMSRPKDERNFWYRRIAPQLDDLEKTVVSWAKASLG